MDERRERIPKEVVVALLYLFAESSKKGEVDYSWPKDLTRNADIGADGYMQFLSSVFLHVSPTIKLELTR